MAYYEPLDSQNKEFRLVDIHPAEERTSVVQCTLRHEKLDSKPPPMYETVSYVWGDPTTRDIMEVNGVAADVPASSVAALRRIRAKTTRRTLWIDALCINQDDMNERSEQVRRMGDIYKSSQGNLVYLGEARDVEKTKLALSDIQAIIDEMNDETETLKVIANTVFDRWKECNPVLATSGMRASIHEELLESQIFDLPWFSRLWVFQEAALAPQNTCILGDHTFSFLDIARASLWITHKQKHMSIELVCNDGRAVVSGLYDYVDKTLGTKANGDQVTLADIMNDTVLMLATDQRDKIFAILGLRDWPGGIPELLAPDYNKAEAHVFRDASRFSLQTRGEEGLTGLDHRRTHDEDLDSDDFISWIIFPGSMWDPVQEPEVFPRNMFCCSGKEEQQWPSSQSALALDPNILSVAGIHLDQVETVSALLTDAIANDVRALNTWLTNALAILQASNLDKVGDVAAVLIAGRNVDEDFATQGDCDALADLQWSIQDAQHIPATMDRFRAPGPGHSAQKDYDRNTRASRYLSALQMACVNRVVFRTKDNYLGVGPKLLRTGDPLAILYGAELPFALRSKERNQYQILGSCYVHGIMFGEGVERHRDRGGEDTIFNLR